MFVGQTVKYHGEKRQLNTEKVRPGTFAVGWEFVGRLLDQLLNSCTPMTSKTFFMLIGYMQATGPIMRFNGIWDRH